MFAANSKRTRWVIVIAFLVCWCGVSETSHAQRSRIRSIQPLREKYQAQRTKLTEQLEELAAYCEQKQQLEGVEEIRQLLANANREHAFGGNLPRKMRADLPATLPPDELKWRKQLRGARIQYARDLYLLSRNVLRSGFYSFAFDLIREVAYFDSDHKQAREILGYVRLDDEWMTPFEKQQRTSSQRYVWHERFGWLPEAHRERYENGERRYKSRWMSAEEESVLRRDFRNAWTVRTEHFLVKTNHSLERGVEIASRLEDYRRYFMQTFAGFFNTPEQLRQMFTGTGGARRISKPHSVHYYRSRDEYNQHLRSAIPQIEITNGLYYTPERTAFFFDDPENANSFDTFYHEATHQFMYEQLGINRDIALNGHFWIVEGIACYMESFRPTAEGFELGDPQHIRFQAARYRLLNDRYYIPMRSFAGMGLKEFQADLQNISKNYSQASGLAHFFMHYGDGEYRDALMTHLREIYLPRRGARTSSLVELTGVSYDELDRQYIAYSKQLQDKLEAANADAE